MAFWLRGSKFNVTVQRSLCILCACVMMQFFCGLAFVASVAVQLVSGDFYSLEAKNRVDMVSLEEHKGKVSHKPRPSLAWDTMVICCSHAGVAGCKRCQRVWLH